ncbi:hypothetical protein T08_14225, partial [Trichinella sp. T8]
MCFDVLRFCRKRFLLRLKSAIGELFQFSLFTMCKIENASNFISLLEPFTFPVSRVPDLFRCFR